MSNKKNSKSRKTRQPSQETTSNKQNKSTKNKVDTKIIDKEKVSTKNTNKDNKALKILKYFMSVGLGLTLAGAIAATVILVSAYNKIGNVDINAIQNSMSRPSIVYDANGMIVDSLKSSTSQLVVNYEDIPQDLKDAILAIEDTDFYSHAGFNFTRTVGAFIHNLKVGYTAQGGSTITQQLAKNVYLTNEKTLDRKVKELVYSFIIENKMTKNEILASYLNTIYLGKGSYGVASASKNYFNKDIKDLTLQESALLAGMTKYPTKYDGYKSLPIAVNDDVKKLELVFYPLSKNVTDEDKAIYKKMLSEKVIDKVTYKELATGQRTVFKAVFNPESKKRQELVLSRMLEVGCITRDEYNSAIKAPIKIDVPEQNRNEISSYFVDYAKNKVLEELIEKGYTHEEAKYMLYNGGLNIYTTMDITMQEKAEDQFENPRNFPSTKYDSVGIPQPQAAMVILDPKTGFVKAMVGGRGVHGYDLYNRAINPRQPGSAIKPLAAYLPAMMYENMYPSTVTEDTPMYYKGDRYPNNYNHKYKGFISMTSAVKYSSNVVAARTLLALGDNEKQSVKKSIDFMRELGISTIVTRDQSYSRNDEHLPIVLGGMTKGITPFDMAGAYGAIANGGIYSKPMVVNKVIDYTGKSLIENSIEKKRVFSEQVAFMMNEMLLAVVDSGTGTRAELNRGMESAGKTGTTNGNKDGWFAGYTPYLVGVTWMGSDIPDYIYGVSGRATSLWKNVMNSIHKDYKPKKFYENAKIKEVSVCKDTGLLANKKDKKLNKDIKVRFLSEFIPNKYCTKHEYTEYDEWVETQKEEEDRLKKEEEERLKREKEEASKKTSENASENVSPDSSVSDEDAAASSDSEASMNDSKETTSENTSKGSEQHNSENINTNN